MNDAIINSLADLKTWSSSYNLILNTDINIDSTTNFTPLILKNSTVNIDGRGHTISIDYNPGLWRGLFIIAGINVSNVTIQNLTLIFNQPGSYTNSNGGAIIGSNFNFPLNSNINVSYCNVIGINISGANSGGIVGANLNVKIVGCCTKCSITGSG